jgi:hypothetical protein
VLLAVFVGFLPASSRADSQVRIVRLSYVEGDVQIDRRDGRGFERAFLNMPVISGTRLGTGDNALAEVEFEEGSTIRLAPATRIEFSELSRRDSGRPSSSIELQDGRAYFDLKRKHEEEFSIEVGRRQVRLPKSARFRLTLQGTEAKLAVFKGELKVTANTSGGWLEVRKNETLTLDLEDASRYFLAKEISPDRYDDWDSERDAYRDRYASNTGNLPYGCGVSDLSYYGNFFYMPPYGYVWRPALVSSAWNPFADGAWVWYPGFGYTWVSGYPWGWVPYHYGSWFFISGYGWCWNPGGRWGNWTNIPNVVDPPPGFNPPRPPAGGGGSGVVMVGRGPSPGMGGGRRPVLDNPDANRTPTGVSERGVGPSNTSGSSDAASGRGPSAAAPRGNPSGSGASRVPATPNTIRTDGGSKRFGGAESGAPRATPRSAPPRSAPSPAASGAGSRPSAPTVGRPSSSFGGSHPSRGSSHGGSQPRSNNPR